MDLSQITNYLYEYNEKKDDELLYFLHDEKTQSNAPIVGMPMVEVKEEKIDQMLPQYEEYFVTFVKSPPSFEQKDNEINILQSFPLQSKNEQTLFGLAHYLKNTMKMNDTILLKTDSEEKTIAAILNENEDVESYHFAVARNENTFTINVVGRAKELQKNEPVLWLYKFQDDEDEKLNVVVKSALLNSNMTVVLLDDGAIFFDFPELFEENEEDQDDSFEMLKFKILRNNGGVWITSQCIVFSSMIPYTKFGFCTFQQLDSSYFNIISCKQDSPVMEKLIKIKEKQGDLTKALENNPSIKLFQSVDSIELRDPQEYLSDKYSFEDIVSFKLQDPPALSKVSPLTFVYIDSAEVWDQVGFKTVNLFDSIIKQSLFLR